MLQAYLPIEHQQFVQMQYTGGGYSELYFGPILLFMADGALKEVSPRLKHMFSNGCTPYAAALPNHAYLVADANANERKA